MVRNNAMLTAFNLEKMYGDTIAQHSISLRNGAAVLQTVECNVKAWAVC